MLWVMVTLVAFKQVDTHAEKACSFPARPTTVKRAQTPIWTRFFVWATMHGLATVLKSPSIATLPITPSKLGKALTHAFQRVRGAIKADLPA